VRLSLIREPWSIGADEDQRGVTSIYRVNSGLKDHGPGSAYRFWALARIKFEATDAKGMPDPGTSARLRELEERFASGAEQRDDLVIVGWFTTADLGRSYCFYATDPECLPTFIGTSLVPYQGECDNYRGGDDPEWAVYRELLWHVMEGEPDILLLKRLTDTYDLDAKEVRRVDHTLLFGDRASAESARNALPEELPTDGPYPDR
jgi:hypothetical protein